MLYAIARKKKKKKETTKPNKQTNNDKKKSRWGERKDLTAVPCRAPLTPRFPSRGFLIHTETAAFVSPAWKTKGIL